MIIRQIRLYEGRKHIILYKKKYKLRKPALACNSSSFEDRKRQQLQNIPIKIDNNRNFTRPRNVGRGVKDRPFGWEAKHL